MWSSAEAIPQAEPAEENADERRPAGATQPPAPSSGYGQPYGYGPQPYDYPQHYASATQQQNPYGYGYRLCRRSPPMRSLRRAAWPHPPAAPGRNWMLIGGCAAVSRCRRASPIGVATDHATTTAGTALDGSAANEPGATVQPQRRTRSRSATATEAAAVRAQARVRVLARAPRRVRPRPVAEQEIGVVDIDTVIGYNEGEAAGTGLVLDSSGDIVTNNHVIDEATTIKVTIVSTGKTYSANVVGTAPTQDIAVIKLVGASGLTKANYGNSSGVKVGDAVTGVGNAGGVGGTPSAADGTVTALNQTITASDESGQNSEQLTGVIATNAPIKAGDSGGPLYSSSDKIIGIDTAANTSPATSRPGSRSRSTTRSRSPHRSRPASRRARSTSERPPHSASPSTQPRQERGGNVVLAVAQVYAGCAAAAAGIVPGDVITAVNGTTVTGLTQLKSLISAHEPGAQISVTYTDLSGTSHIRDGDPRRHGPG